MKYAIILTLSLISINAQAVITQRDYNAAMHAFTRGATGAPEQMLQGQKMDTEEEAAYESLGASDQALHPNQGRKCRFDTDCQDMGLSCQKTKYQVIGVCVEK